MTTLAQEQQSKEALKYDVLLSFAGKQRDYVDAVARILKVRGVSVFYDKDEEANLWGKDLVEHFDELYQRAGRFCIIFISYAYKEGLWTYQERQSALVRAFRQRGQEYILPARFDDTEIPGIRPTMGYIDLRKKSPEEFVELILTKLGKQAERTQSSGSSFRTPRLKPQQFNPYDEAQTFIAQLGDGLKSRCAKLAASGIAFSILSRNGTTCIRILQNGITKYSLDVSMGGHLGDSALTFYGLRGEMRSWSSGSSNAWGHIKWDKQAGAPVLEFHNLSLIRHLGESVMYKGNEFLEVLWDVICDVLEQED